jgi:PAS domain S-box-containing protein
MKAVTREERRVAYPPVLVFCLLAAGIFTSAMGLLTLLGWVFKLPLLASFRAGLIPMAPSSAVLFLLYGAAICLRAPLPLSRRAFGISLAVGCLGALVALLLFTLGCLNIHLDVEHPGLNIIDVAGKAPLGHMSPVTAFGFLLASLSFLASLSISATRPWRTGLALGAAGLLAGTSFIFLLAYIYGTPLLYGSAILPPALNSILTFVILGFALLALTVRTAKLSGGLPGDGSRTAFFLTLIFALLAAGIVTTGYHYYRNYERQFRADAERELSAIADLKVNELAQYRNERLWDAGAFFKNPAFSSLVRRFLDHPEDPEALPQLQEWAAKYLRTEQYDLICLFDTQGVIRMAIPVEPPISSFVSQNVSEILRSDRVIFQDFTRNEHDQRTYLALLVPIFDESDANRPLGVLALQIDPYTYLYPFIQHWPTPSRTGETLLVRRDGNNALFINELKFQTNTALNLRISLANTNAPAVKAVLGQEGVVEGRDYREAPALAALQTVPDSPWFLVAKMDTAEVYAPLRERLKLTILFVGLLLVSAGLGMGAFWRHQRVRFYKKRYQVAEALRESEERFRRVFEESPTGMAMLDETFRFIRVNPAFAAMLEYSGEELQKMTFPDITNPDHVQLDVEQVRRLLRGELAVYRTEKRYIARSGKELWGQVQVTVVRNADGAFRYFLAIVGNITERKQAEQELRRSETKFRTLYDLNSDAVMLLDEKSFFDCNPATLAMFGCATREEFCSKHPADVSPPVQPDGTDSRTLANQRIATAREKGTNHFEWMHKRTDTGETFTADVLLNAMELDGKPVLQAVVRDITGRKQVEEALQNSRALYFSLVENLPQSIFRKDRDGRFQFVNERFCRDLKRSAKDIVGRTDSDFFPPELAQAYRKDDLRVMETGQVLDQEERHVGANGQELFVHVIKTPLRDAQGRVIGIQGVFWDITERKQAEETLRYEQTLLATLMDNLPDAIYFKDAASRFLRTNRALSRKFGLSDPGQIVGKSDTDFFTREHSRQALADEQEIVRTGQPLLNVEEKETWMDGTVSWVMTTKLPLRDATGRIIGTCGISRDITERKRMEEALRESQALYHSLVQQLPVGLFRKDREGRYVLVNPHFCWLRGMKAEDFLGKSPREVAAVEMAKQGEMGFATKYAANGMEHHEQIMRTGKPIELVEEYEHADGTKRFLHVVKLPVLGPDGKIIGTQGIQFDITDIKQAEETIAHERQLLRTLIDLLPETFYIKDLDSRFLVANEALAKQWGKASPSELIGLSDADLFPAGQAAEYRAAELKVFAGEPFMGREGTCVFADGREHMVLTTKVPYRDSQGRICGLVGFGYDITERKRAEQELKESETRFRRLSEASFEAVTFHKQGVLLNANDQYFKMFGYSREELLGKEVLSLTIAPEALEYVLEQVRNSGLGPYETIGVRKDGTRFPVEIRVREMEQEGQIIRVGAIRDITERKRAELALKESEVRYQRISEAITDYIYTVRVADGRAVETTHGPGCLAVTGYEVKEFANDPFLWLRMVVAEDRPMVEEQARRILAGEDPPPIEHRIVHKNGTERWVRNTFVPHRNERGTLVSYDGLVQDITGRKRAELALRESEERMRITLETTKIGSWDWDVKKDVWYASPTYFTMLGYEPDPEHVDREKWLQRVHPDDRAANVAKIQEVLAGTSSGYQYEHRIKHADGSYRWHSVIGHTVASDENGKPVRLIGVRMDITEHKRTEETLKESATQLRAVLDATPFPVAMVDVQDNNIEFWSRSALTIFGHVAPTTTEWYQMAYPDPDYQREVIERWKPCVEQARRSGQVVNTGEYRIACRDGSVRICELYAIFLADKLIVIFNDLTERKRAEEALRGSEAELRAILDSTGDGILAVDRSGEKVIKANRRYAEMWRIPQSIIDAGDNNALRNSVLNRLSDPDAFLKRVHELYDTDIVAVDTLFFKDGRIFERHGFPMMLAGAVLGRVWSFRDITERKRQERELAEKSAELERFTYTVSHDLKSPLVTVKTFLGYLEQDLLNPDTERVKQDVGYMRGAADKMGHLLDELLNLARVGRKMNPPVRVTFQELAQEAVKLVAGRISTSRAEVSVAAAAVVLEGDRPRLVEIWQNLVENACKFMGDQAKPRVEIGVEQRGSETVFFVRDNGVGIEPRYQEKVFSLFEKLNPKIEGTGMGLALVKRVVELYKGRIWVESGGLGQGANFLFTLPGAIIVEAETGQSS